MCKYIFETIKKIRKTSKPKHFYAEENIRTYYHLTASLTPLFEITYQYAQQVLDGLTCVLWVIIVLQEIFSDAH